MVPRTLVLEPPAPAQGRPPVASPAAPGAQTRFYVPALDGLRVFAFLGVFLFHALIPILVVNTPLKAWISCVLLAGMNGVPLFFVLSAFLISRLLLMEKERTGRVDLRAYYVRRVLRIWPLYFLVVAVGLGIAHCQGHPIRDAAFHAVTFTFNSCSSTPPSLGPLWSLSVEEQFYLVWPLALSILSLRGLRNVCGVMIAIALVGRCVIMHRTGSWITMWGATTSHLDSLALGTLLAMNFDRIPRFSRAQWGVLSLVCVLGICMIMRVFPPMMTSMRTALGYSAIPVLCTGLVGLAIGSRDTILARPNVAAFGRLTFGLYCWHVFPLVLTPANTAVRLLACLLGTVAVATLTYYGVERPFLSLKHRFQRVQTRLA